MVQNLAIFLTLTGAFSLILGIGAAIVLQLRISFRQPDWIDTFSFNIARRLKFLSKAGQLGRAAENTTRLGKLSNKLLQVGTFCLFLAGAAKIVGLVIERS
jgi:hypothetical protein